MHSNFRLFSVSWRPPCGDHTFSRLHLSRTICNNLFMAQRKPIFMENTEVPPERSAASIVSLLVSAGARSVNMRYGEDQKLCGIDFTFMHGPLEFPFSIPARISQLFDRMWAARKNKYLSDKPKVLDQAERVAWRQLFRWVEAQVALIDTGMVSNVEVFTPYCINRDGRTVFELMMASRMKELPAAETPQ